MSGRSYFSGVEKALFLLSRGRCYEPTCQTPVLRLINGEPIVNVHIAHICPHDDNGPRCVSGLSKEERRSFRNLILLCMAHHTVVDARRHEADYPEAVLLKWKSEREGEFGTALTSIDNLTEEKLQVMMAAAVQHVGDGITAAINEFGVISESAAEILHGLKAEMFQRPYLDMDAVASLADSAYRLRNLEDNAATLSDAAWKLRDLEDNAATLSDAAWKLRNLEDNAGSLNYAATRLVEVEPECLIPAAEKMSEAVERAQQITRNMRVSRDESYPIAISEPFMQYDGSRKWAYFKWGLILGASAVIAILIAVLVLLHQHTG